MYPVHNLIDWMKTQCLLGAVLLAASSPCFGATFNYQYSDTGTIQAGNPAPLVTPSHLINDGLDPIANLILTVNLNSKDALGEITGTLYLGDLGGSPFSQNFSLSHSSATTIVDFSSLFAGKNPNDYW